MNYEIADEVKIRRPMPSLYMVSVLYWFLLCHFLTWLKSCLHTVALQSSTGSRPVHVLSMRTQGGQH